MRTVVLISALIWISALTGCSHVVGNVVPEKGPTMEQVYDGMDSEKRIIAPPTHGYKESHNMSEHAVKRQFSKLENPELSMYVFPHLAGNDEVPVPGYYTQFNAYDRTYYALPMEQTRIG